MRIFRRVCICRGAVWSSATSSLRSSFRMEGSRAAAGAAGQTGGGTP
eukprot:CAMPEP_0206144612 /NCGR_PEP_ID=MMETSP1473-20131121/24595_1 /ASSEMBLY_ACC=CAM_ASM_001109 /TAXON_ID=1461547 /ORGANISM="Stichococcus sp, Strain RCC1054" /LENGTH=46 /DNA_ID= /DNA_START= /DNA_END= /DNA_ORIENTATION=